MKVPCVEIPELTSVLSGVGQNIVVYASPTAREFLLVLMPTMQVYSPSV